MKITEVVVSELELTFDILRDSVAAEVYSRYSEIENKSNGFIVSAIDAYNPEELDILRHEGQNVLGYVNIIFTVDSQTYKLINYLVNYLTD